MDRTSTAAIVDSHELVAHVVTELGRFDDGQHADLDFLTHAAIKDFCAALGFAADRDWGALVLDEIAPVGPEGVNMVPEDEAAQVLDALRFMLQKKLVEPEAGGEAAPHLLNDFLPAGHQFNKRECLGHLWEFQYALAVELEHGTTRGTNVTGNHPLLTGMVVMAHLAEDTLYYARLWVMETQGELFNAQLDHAGPAVVDETLRHLSLAEKHLQARISEKLDQHGHAHG